MRPRNLPIALGLLLAGAACGPAEVVVTVQIETENPAGDGTVVLSLSNVEIQLLPYDRDQVFDSLEAAHPTPEPPIPGALLGARAGVAAAQERWQIGERRWNNLHDTLEKITETMQQHSRGEARYVALFQEFTEHEAQLERVEAETRAAFAEFSELQRVSLSQSDSLRLLRDAWSDEAFADAPEIFLAKLRASGLEARVDTTDPSGVARENLKVKPGRYWVHARYELHFTELYWNVPVQVERGDPVQVRLTRENAQERIKL